MRCTTVIAPVFASCAAAREISIHAGTVGSWTNASGHFRPAAQFPGHANLPQGSFRALRFLRWLELRSCHFFVQQPSYMLFRIFDVEIETPQSVRLVGETESIERLTTYRFEGRAVGEFAAPIGASAARVGFVERAIPAGLILERGLESIRVLRLDSKALLLTIDRPSSHPEAEIGHDEIRIGGIVIPLLNLRTVPGRERHLAGSRTWIADWTIMNISPLFVSQLIVDALRERGFPKAVTYSRKDSRPEEPVSSHADAAGATVRVYASAVGPDVALRIEVIR